MLQKNLVRMVPGRVETLKATKKSTIENQLENQIKEDFNSRN